MPRSGVVEVAEVAPGETQRQSLGTDVAIYALREGIGDSDLAKGDIVQLLEPVVVNDTIAPIN